MEQRLLKGRKAIMAALQITSCRAFYRIQHKLPLGRVEGRLVANYDELIKAYCRLGRPQRRSD